jgi:hypothetical protein
MNRLLLIILLVGIGIYLYIILFNNNDSDNNEKMITDDFTEKLPPNWNKSHSKNLKVHFSDKVDIKHIEPIEHIKEDTESMNELFQLNPRTVENTNLTMSENEYF